MSTLRKMTSIAGFVVLAGSASLFTATAALAAAPATLPAITLTPNPVATTGTFTAAGSGCIDSGGTLGTVSVSILGPNGSVTDGGNPTVGDGGSWTSNYSPMNNGAVAPGSYTVNASCDVYNTTVNYPAASLQVNAVVDDPTATVNKTVVTAGSPIVVGAKGFAGNAVITATLNSTPVVLGTMTTDANGAASATLTIPANTVPGTHTIVLSSADGTTASVTITVQGVIVTVSVNTATLANTGTDASAMGAIAVGLLALGGAAVFAGRRKQDS